jgi:hypothetical protein
MVFNRVSKVQKSPFDGNKPSIWLSLGSEFADLSLRNRCPLALLAECSKSFGASLGYSATYIKAMVCISRPYQCLIHLNFLIDQILILRFAAGVSQEHGFTRDLGEVRCHFAKNQSPSSRDLGFPRL